MESAFHPFRVQIIPVKLFQSFKTSISLLKFKFFSLPIVPKNIGLQNLLRAVFPLTTYWHVNITAVGVLLGSGPTCFTL